MPPYSERADQGGLPAPMDNRFERRVGALADICQVAVHSKSRDPVVGRDVNAGLRLWKARIMVQDG